jgi:hypothetical protein
MVPIARPALERAGIARHPGTINVVGALSAKENGAAGAVDVLVELAVDPGFEEIDLVDAVIPVRGNASWLQVSGYATPQ